MWSILKSFSTSGRPTGYWAKTTCLFLCSSMCGLFFGSLRGKRMRHVCLSFRRRYARKRPDYPAYKPSSRIAPETLDFVLVARDLFECLVRKTQGRMGQTNSSSSRQSLTETISRTASVIRSGRCTPTHLLDPRVRLHILSQADTPVLSVQAPMPLAPSTVHVLCGEGMGCALDGYPGGVHFLTHPLASHLVEYPLLILPPPRCPVYTGP